VVELALVAGEAAQLRDGQAVGFASDEPREDGLHDLAS
jgi:hypothetical protein